MIKFRKLSILTMAMVCAGDICAQRKPAEEGPFSPTWESLSQYEAPEWFRNAKFGIWAHWGPQCQPEAGDWYGRAMYEEEAMPTRNISRNTVILLNSVSRT